MKQTRRVKVNSKKEYFCFDSGLEKHQDLSIDKFNLQFS